MLAGAVVGKARQRCSVRDAGFQGQAGGHGQALAPKAQAPGVGASPPLFYYIHLCLYVHVCVCHGCGWRSQDSLQESSHVGCGAHTQVAGLSGSYLPVQSPH